MTGPTGGDKTNPFGGQATIEWHFVRVGGPAGEGEVNLLQNRIVITGVPSAGKTTVAKELVSLSKATLLHTDDLKDTHGWSESSLEVSHWFDGPGPWIIEGVTAVRALRKWMKNNPEGKPCDAVFWMGEPVVPIEGGVLSLAKGCHTVWNGIVDELAARGVAILRPSTQP